MHLGGICRAHRISLRLLLLLVCTPPFGGPIRGQQSYVAQKAASGRADLNAAAKKPEPSPTRRAIPTRFAGWIKAQHDGPDIVGKFAELRTRKSWKMRANPNARPFSGVAVAGDR